LIRAAMNPCFCCARWRSSGRHTYQRGITAQKLRKLSGTKWKVVWLTRLQKSDVFATFSQFPAKICKANSVNDCKGEQWYKPLPPSLRPFLDSTIPPPVPSSPFPCLPPSFSFILHPFPSARLPSLSSPSVWACMCAVYNCTRIRPKAGR
jgi:hypothetical protein